MIVERQQVGVTNLRRIGRRILPKELWAKVLSLHGLVVLECDGRTLRVWDPGGYETRHDQVYKLLCQSLHDQRIPAFEPIILSTADFPPDVGEPILAFCKSSDDRLVTAVPDFVFECWPETGVEDFDVEARRIAVASQHPPLEQKVVWRGNINTHPIRREVVRLASDRLGKLDAQHVEIAGSLGGGGQVISLAKQVRNWACLLDIEGRGYSGRLKLLAHAQRPLIVVDRPYVEYWHEEALAEGLFIRVDRSLQSLGTAVDVALDNPDQSMVSSRLAWASTYLTQEAARRRWLEALRAVPDGDRPRARSIRSLLSFLHRRSLAF